MKDLEKIKRGIRINKRIMLGLYCFIGFIIIYGAFKMNDYNEQIERWDFIIDSVQHVEDSLRMNYP